MKITDLIVETEQQIDELGVADVAKGVGKVAKGVGAVAGGAAGAWDAAKKGFSAGRAAVAGGGAADAEEPATTAADANAQGPAGTAPAQAQTGAAGQALAKSAQAVAGAGTDKKQGDALYAQIKASIGQLDPAGKKKILQLVQKSMAEKPAEPAADAAPQQSMADKVAAAQTPAQGNEPAAAEPAAQAAAPAEEPGYDPQTGVANATMAAQNRAAGKAKAPFGFNDQTGEPFASQADADAFNADRAKQVAGGASKPAAEPAQQAAAPAGQEPAPAADGKMTPQQIAAKKAELQGKRAAGKTVGTTASGFNQYTKDASSQRIVGANPDGSPKIQQIKASKINLGNNLSEALAAKVELQKRKMFESGLVNGQTSVFKK